MKTYKNLASVIRQVVTEAHKKDDLPFDGPYTKSKGNVKDKSGAVHTPMSRAKDLARKAMQQKMKESFDLDITEEEADDLLEHILELDELSVATLSSYGKKAEKSANKNLDQSVKHQEKALDQYNKGGSSADRSYDTQIRAIKHAGISDKRTAGTNLAAKKLARKFSKGMTEEEAYDLLNSIQEAKEIKEESEWMRTMHFKSEDHEREAAKHLSDADAHKKSGNMPEHYAAMINHYTSKARALEKKTPLRGTGPG